MLSKDGDRLLNSSNCQDVNRYHAYIDQEHNVGRWQIINNFTARMEWVANGVGNRDPELMINGIGGLSPIEIKVSPGESVKLDISGSNDPDGDGLGYKWWIMP